MNNSRNFQLFEKSCIESSKKVTHLFSTSFSLGIKLLNSKFRDPVYAVYGFVRLADEIVDSFHQFNQKQLIQQFEQDTWQAISEGISLNPVLHSFQKVVNQYQFDKELIESFLISMKADLAKKMHEKDSYQTYIYGSAEVVGLMCLRIFTENDDALYQSLKPQAQRLGAAFQKVNFLRDLREDYQELGRTYFPGLTAHNFNEDFKKEIEKEIESDFNEGLQGIKKLPVSCRLGVYVAYVYYRSLFQKIISTPPSEVMQQRIRIPDSKKLLLLMNSWFKHAFNLL